MIELSRFQLLRPLQTISEEEKLHIGLPLYPDDQLSNFANALRGAKTSGEFSEVVALFFRSQNVLVDTTNLNPIIKALYDWLAYKARPIALKDFKAFAKSLNIGAGVTLEDEWPIYADNLIAAIAKGILHLNYCVDFQLLIRVCYVLRECLKVNNNVYEVEASVTAELLDRLLTLPIVLPKHVDYSRCRENCSQPRSATLPKPRVEEANVRVREPSCECTCDDRCQNPSNYCICIKTYVADLFVIKEELNRYEEGDIADIENILAGEKKVRKHRTLDRTEVTSESETQTETSEERDHQVDEKFGLQSEVKNTVDEKVNVDAGVTATLKYGDSVTLTPHANVTANFAKSQSDSTARSYAKDVLDRAVTKFQEKVRKLQISKTLSELEEHNLHSIDNTKAGADHRAGIYYWVNKVTHAQVFNYGKHMMFDAVLPEPAAIFKKLYKLKLQKDKDAKAPTKPNVTPDDIQRGTYGALLNQYGISSTEDMYPPANSVCVAVAFSQNISEPEKTLTSGFSSSETKVTIPTGYAAKSMSFAVECYTGSPASTEGTLDDAERWPPEFGPVAKLVFSRSAQCEKEQINETQTKTVQWRLQSQGWPGGDNRS